MNKRPSFADDLALVQTSVDDSVTDILQAAKKKHDEKLRVVATEPVVEVKVDVEEPKREEDSGTQPPRPKAPSRSPKQGPSEEVAQVLQNVTTRLTRETNELLTEAALRQRLKKELPDTRQDIVETALRDWLKRQGYGRSRGRDNGDS